MKTHSPSRTYNQGDRCYIEHSVNGVIQRYTFEATDVCKGIFYPCGWRNVTPRAWRLVSLDIDGFVYQGDTIIVNNKAYKNTSNGIQLIREFMETPLDGIAFSSFYSEGYSKTFELNYQNTFIDDIGRNMTPTWNKQSRRNLGGTFRLVNYEVILKVNTIDVPVSFLDSYTVDSHTLTLNRGTYTSWNLISTPDTGNSSSQTIVYNLTGTEGDFQYFIIRNSEGVLSVEKLAVNDSL